MRQAIPLEPGMRVRCVDDSERPSNDKHARLTKGREYEILSTDDQFVTVDDDLGEKGGWWPDRFKPVVRVKWKLAYAPSNPQTLPASWKSGVSFEGC